MAGAFKPASASPHLIKAIAAIAVGERAPRCKRTGYCAMSADKRRAPRQDLQWEGLIIGSAGSIIGRCIVVNIAATGAKLALQDSADVPDIFVLLLSKNGEVRRQCEVMWRTADSIGVQFTQPSTADEENVSFLDDALARIGSKN